MTDQFDADVRSAGLRRERRAFIRTHHPDAGGDHDTFIDGLANLELPRALDPPTARPRVTVTPRQAWPVSLTTVLLQRLRRRHRAPRVR